MKPIIAYAVFGPDGRMETARASHDQAVAAARIIGGTDWELHGFSVESVTVIRHNPAPSKNHGENR